MSRAHKVMYQLKRQKREELAKKRAAEYSEKILKTISVQYEKMLQADFDSYVKEEVKNFKDGISRLSHLIGEDPFAAEQLARELSYTTDTISFLVERAKEEFERKERLQYEKLQRQREETKSKLADYLYQQLAEINNSSVMNFGIRDLDELKEKINSGEIKNESNVNERLSKIVKISAQKFEQWKAEKLEKEKINLLKKQIDSSINSVQDEKFENKEKQIGIITRMQELKNSVTAQSDSERIVSKLKELNSEVSETLIDESVRKEMVKSIIGELRKQEFTVEKPKIIGEGKESYVIIKAKKPSGKTAECKVSLEGKLNYRFDKYEGMTCLKDIEKFNIDLEKIYSFNLSDERIIWENPDRLSRTESVSADYNRRNV